MAAEDTGASDVSVNVSEKETVVVFTCLRCFHETDQFLSGVSGVLSLLTRLTLMQIVPGP